MTKRYLYLFGGAIGEATLAFHMGRVLAANVPGAVLEIVSTRPNGFVRELAAELSFIRFRALAKGDWRSWLQLPTLLLSRYYSVVYEPVTTTLPLWWKLILWCARFQPGSKQIRYQMHGHERTPEQGVTALTYVCTNENLFDTPPAVLSSWGIPVHTVPAPELPTKEPPTSEPYLLFHFFAGNYRRSIPVDHARAILMAARAQFPDHLFIISCMNSERARAEEMCEGIAHIEIKSGLPAVEVLSWLSGAAVMVGTASGIVFLSAQMGVPTVSMSCLVDPCWLPTYAPNVITLAAYAECTCTGDKTSECNAPTPEGDVFRCLYYITTEEVIQAMQQSLPTA